MQADGRDQPRDSACRVPFRQLQANSQYFVVLFRSCCRPNIHVVSRGLAPSNDADRLVLDLHRREGLTLCYVDSELR